MANAKAVAQLKGLVLNKQSLAAADAVQSPAICRIPSPRVHATTNQTATCPVCKRTGLCVVNATGLLRQHGPRGNACAGSHSRPVPGSQQQQNQKPAVSLLSRAGVVAIPTTSASASSAAAAASPVDAPNQSTTAPSAPSFSDALKHPTHNPHILKRIPKGARPAVSNLLQKLLQDVLLHPTSTDSWSRLLGFSAACLAKPERGGKSRNLTTSIVKQVRQYETGSYQPDRPPINCRTARRNKQSKSLDEQIAAIASAKLEDGDVKGAVRLLCSNDKLAAPGLLTHQHSANYSGYIQALRRTVALFLYH